MTQDPAQEAAHRRRQLVHLIAMCDGKRHGFFDHALAAEMLAKGWIARQLGSYVITDAGRHETAAVGVRRMHGHDGQGDAMGRDGRADF